VRDGDRVTKRCRRWDAAGQAHALTFSCYRSLPYLAQGPAGAWQRGPVFLVWGRDIG